MNNFGYYTEYGIQDVKVYGIQVIKRQKTIKKLKIL